MSHIALRHWRVMFLFSLHLGVNRLSTLLAKCVLIKELYEAARLRGYLHCFRLVLGVQNLYEAVITSLSFHNPFEIGLMKRVRYLVEVLGVRYFAEVLGQCLRSTTFDDIVHRSRTESI